MVKPHLDVGLKGTIEGSLVSFRWPVGALLGFPAPNLVSRPKDVRSSSSTVKQVNLLKKSSLEEDVTKGLVPRFLFLFSSLST